MSRPSSQRRAQRDRATARKRGRSCQFRWRSYTARMRRRQRHTRRAHGRRRKRTRRQQRQRRQRQQRRGQRWTCDSSRSWSSSSACSNSNSSAWRINSQRTIRWRQRRSSRWASRSPSSSSSSSNSSSRAGTGPAGRSPAIYASKPAISRSGAHRTPETSRGQRRAEPHQRSVDSTHGRRRCSMSWPHSGSNSTAQSGTNNTPHSGSKRQRQREGRRERRLTQAWCVAWVSVSKGRTGKELSSYRAPAHLTYLTPARAPQQPNLPAPAGAAERARKESTCSTRNRERTSESQSSRSRRSSRRHWNTREMRLARSYRSQKSCRFGLKTDSTDGGSSAARTRRMSEMRGATRKGERHRRRHRCRSERWWDRGTNGTLTERPWDRAASARGRDTTRRHAWSCPCASRMSRRAREQSYRDARWHSCKGCWREERGRRRRGPCERGKAG